MHTVLGLTDFPDVLDDSLSVPGITLTCCQFNPHGTLVAAGSREGHIVLFDFLTRSVAKTLTYPSLLLTAAAPPLIDPLSPFVRPPPPVVSAKSDRFVNLPPTSVSCCSWSSNSRRLLTAFADGLACLWDVLSGELLAMVKHTSWMKHAQLQPRDSFECLLCPNDEEPVVVHFRKSTTPTTADGGEAAVDATTTAPASSLLSHSIRPVSASVFPSADTKKETLTFALYDHTGHYIVAGGSKCGLYVFARDGLSPISTQALSTGRASSVLSMCRSNCGRFLLVNTADRTLRLWACNNHNSKPASTSTSSPSPSSTSSSPLQPPPPPQFSHVQHHADVVDRIAWKRAIFSHTADYLIGGRGDRFSHQLYVWDRVAQQLVRVIDGAEEGLVDIAFHPRQCFMLVVGSSGRCYVWCKRVERIQEAVLNAFAPDFVVLDDNEEYIEREDEFDVKHIKPPQQQQQQPPLAAHGLHTHSSDQSVAAADGMDGTVGVARDGHDELGADSVDICGLDGVVDEDEGGGEEGRPLVTLPLDQAPLVNGGTSASDVAGVAEPVHKRQKTLT